LVRKQFRWLALLILGVTAAARPGSAATILGGLEDWGRAGGLEHNGDFNDLVFQITGNVTLNAPGGTFSNLTPGVVNENGTVFWDNLSGDGSDKNVGYYMLGLGGNLQYLATASGGSINNVTFSEQGPLTITLVGGITANTALNTLGWYDPANPGLLHQPFAGGRQGASAIFNPSSMFALYSGNGWGQTFTSITADNIAESATQQHFAFFTSDVSPQSVVPEPSDGVMVAIGVGLITLGSLRRRLAH
jgi:hypothetical protein